MNLLLKVQLIRRNIIIIIVNLCSSIESPRKGLYQSTCECHVTIQKRIIIYTSSFGFVPFQEERRHCLLWKRLCWEVNAEIRWKLTKLIKIKIRGERKTSQHVNNISDLKNGKLFNQSGIASQTKLFHCNRLKNLYDNSTPRQKIGAFTKEKTGPCID